MSKSQQAVAQKPRIRQSGSETATPKPHPVTAPVGDPNHPSTYLEPGELTRTHELIVDAVTAMLTRGGHPDDVAGLLRATMAHTRRRLFEALGASREQVLAMVSEFIAEEFDEWKQDLAEAWRKNRVRPQAPAVPPKSITDRIRFNVRESLIAEFEEFMADASPEEQRFLIEVFQSRSSGSYPAEHGSDEIFIGNAFEQQLTNSPQHYLRVPARLLDAVEKYLSALRAIDDKEVM